MQRVNGTMLATTLVVLITVLGAVTGLGAAETVIQHYNNSAHGPAWTAWLKEQAEVFAAQNPGMKVEIIPGPSSAEEFLTVIAGGTSLDVAELTLRIAASVAAEGVYLDLRPYLERSSVLSLNDYVPVAQRAVTRSDGTIFGVPVDLYLVPTHYHVDMFAARGLVTPSELGEEWNFAAALAASKRLTLDKNGDGVPEDWGTHNPHTLWVYRNAFENRGAEMFDRDTNPTRSLLNTPEVVRALEWLAELNTVHGVANPDSGSYSGEFPQGIYGWSLGTGPNTGKILIDAEASFRWGVALPVGDVRQGSYTAVNSFQIPRTSANPEAAWKWIEFLLASEESWASYITATGRLPASEKVMPMWLESITSQPNPPEGAENYINAAMHPDNYLDILSPLYARFSSLADPLVREVISGERSARAALEEIHQQMTALFNEE